MARFDKLSVWVISWVNERAMATLRRPADQAPSDATELCRESGSDRRADTQEMTWRKKWTGTWVAKSGFSSAFDELQRRFPYFRFGSESSYWLTEPTVVSVSHQGLQSTK